MGLLPSQDADADAESQEAVFRLLGCIYRTLAEPQAFFVWQSLLNPGMREGDLETGREMRPSVPPETQRFHAHWMDPMGETGSNKNHNSGQDLPDDRQILPMYTSRLFEKGQESGQVPRRTISTISIDPPEFKVDISFGSCLGTGNGRTKKVAGHLAAKDLCGQLKIAI